MSKTTRCALALLTLGALACGPGDGASGDDAPAQAEAEAGSGQALFRENCASCHGERALGNGPMASTLPVQPPSLLDHLGHHPMDQLVRIIRTGVPPAMPPAPLDEEEVLRVIDYAWTLVPDSMVAGLREMQRMAEMGMDMSDMNTGAMPPMGHDSMDHSMHPDSAGR